MGEAIDHYKDKVNDLIKDFSIRLNIFNEEHDKVLTNPTNLNASRIEQLKKTNLELKTEGENLEKMKTTLNEKFDALKPIEDAVLVLEKQAEDLKAQYYLLESEIEELKNVIDTSNQNITELNNQIEQISDNINTINEVQTELQNGLETDLNTNIDEYNKKAEQQKRSIRLYGFTVEDLPPSNTP